MKSLYAILSFALTLLFSFSGFAQVTNQYNYSGSVVNWTVPVGVYSININAYGAQGGNNGGRGARIQGTVNVSPGDNLRILVGQRGGYNGTVGGGGGGSFIWNSSAGNSLLIAAGGGGGNTQSFYGSIAGHGSATINPTYSSNGSGNNSGGSNGYGGSGGSIACYSCASYPGTGGGGAGWFGNGGNGYGSASNTTYHATGGRRPLAGGAGGSGFSPFYGTTYGGFGGGGGAAGNYGAAGGGGGFNGGGGGRSWNGSKWGPGGGGGSFNSGTNQVNWSGVRYSNGGVTITYSPCVAATISCPSNITVANTPGQCGANVSFNATGLGNPSPTMSYSPASGSFFAVGTTTVTATATNDCGSQSCTFTVTVNDTEDPTITCPGAVSVTADSVSCEATGVALGTATIADNCAGATVSNDAPTAFPVGITTVTWTVEDASGKTASCTQTVTVTDNEAPVVTCKNPTILLDANGNASITISDVYDGATDNCGVNTNSVSIDVNSVDCSNLPLPPGDPIWINEFHYDNSGTDTGEFVEVAGNAGLDLSTYSILLYNGSNGTVYNTIGLSGTIPDEGAGFGAVDFQLPSNGLQNGSPDGFALVNNGTTVIEFLSYEGVVTATAGPANGTSTNVGVTETSTTAIGTSIQRVGVGNTVASFSWTTNAAESPGTLNAGQTATNGGASVIVSVTDVNGNVGTCTANVTVLDNTDPTVTCNNVTVELDENGIATVDVSDINGGTSDNCGVAGVSFGSGVLATNSAVLTLGNGNDGEGIAFNPNDGLMYHASGISPGFEYFEPIDLDLLTVGSNLAPGNAFPFGLEGEITGMVYYPPLNGFVVMSRDHGIFQIDPVTGVFTALSVFEGGAYTNWLRGFAVVGTSIYGVSRNTSNLIEFNPNTGAIVSTVSVVIDGVERTAGSTGLTTDPNTGDVYIIYKGSGGISQLGTIDVTTGIGTGIGSTGMKFSGISFDNAGNLYAVSGDGATPSETLFVFDGTSGSSSIDFSCDDIGDNTVTLTVTDTSGNTATCNATVTVEDNTDPIAMCTDLPIELDASGNYTLSQAEIDGLGVNSTDNCGGTLTFSVDNAEFDCNDIGAGGPTSSVWINEFHYDNGVVSDTGEFVEVAGTAGIDLSGYTLEFYNGSSTQLNVYSTVSLSGVIADEGDGYGALSFLKSGIQNGSPDGIALVNGGTLVEFISYEGTFTAASGTAAGQASTDVGVSESGSTLPGESLQLSGTGSQGSDFSWIAASAESPGSLNATQTLIGSGPTGVSVVLTVTDSNNNTSTCTANIIVSDTTAPTVVCNDIDVELDASGNYTLTQADLDEMGAGSMDTCGAVTFSVDNAVFNCNNVGANTVTLTVTDESNNTATCTANVNVEDNTDPTIILFPNITVQLDATGNGTLTVGEVDNGSNDACGILSTSIDNTSFTCNDLGGSGAIITESFEDWSDTSYGTITNAALPSGLWESNNSLLGSPAHTGTRGVRFNDDSGENEYLLYKGTDGNGKDGGLGTISFWYRHWDGDGSNVEFQVQYNQSGAGWTNIGGVVNSPSTSWTQFSESPNILGDDILVRIISIDDAERVSFDDFSMSDYSGGPTVTLTVTDNNNNVSTATANVTVEDNINPVAMCNEITVQLDATGNYTLTQDDIDAIGAGSTDACGIDSFSVDTADFDCSNIGIPNGVSLTVTDSSGNESTCQANIIVEDNIAPVVLCQNIPLLELDASGNASIVAADIDAGSYDSCSDITLSLSQSTFNCDDIGAVANSNDLFISEYIEGSSNNKCIEIYNGTGVSVNLADYDLVRYSNGSLAGTTIALSGTVADGDVHVICNGSAAAAFQAQADQTSGSINFNGNDAVALRNSGTAIDIFGMIGENPGSRWDVNSIDTQDQTLVRRPNVYGGNTDNASGFPALGSEWIELPNNDSSNLGTHTINNDGVGVTLTATDAYGNSSSCIAVVKVEDNIAPNIECTELNLYLSDAASFTITPDQITNFISDNCEYTVALSQDLFSCEDVGGDLSNLIISEYIDGPGNENAIEIYNGTGVTVDLSEYTLEISYNGGGSTEFTLGGSVDEGIPAIVAHSLSSLTMVANNIVDLDFDGNDAIALKHNGTVIDLLPVYTSGVSLSGTTLIRNADINAGNLSNSSGSDGWTQYANSFIANLGSHTIDITTNVNNVEIIVTDSSGNTNTCIANVIVHDDIPPIAQCQSNLVVQLDNLGGGILTAAEVDNGSYDECSNIKSLSIDREEFGCADVGQTFTVTLTVIDTYDNESTCTTSVTVEDNVDPVAICKPVTVMLDASGNGSITVADVNDGSNDACGIASMTLDNSSFTCSDVGGANVVTLTVTDNNNNVSTCQATVTVEDNVLPTAVCGQNLSFTLDATGSVTIDGNDIDDGSNDACGILSLEVSPSTFGCDDLGDNTVTLTVTDNNNNVSTCTTTITIEGDLPEITFSESDLPELCQGDFVLLTANSALGVDYEWFLNGVATGDTTDTIEVYADGTYGVNVTSATNCTTYAEHVISGFDLGALVSAYTILAGNEVFLHGGNLVQSGGVGAMNPSTGNIKLHQASNIAGFGQAVSFDLQQGSAIGTQVLAAANPTIPAFITNTYSNAGSPDETINNNQNVTLTGSVYGRVTVKSGATVTFSQSNVYIDELKTFSDATIEFAGCANVFINDKFFLAQNGVINSNGNNVVFYVNEDVQIEKGSDVRARIHSNGNEILAKGENGNGNNMGEPTYMTGLFIANKVHGNKNVIWNADPLCDPCPVAAPLTNPGVDNPAFRLSFEVDAWPNPSESEFNVKVNTTELQTIQIDVFDMSNKLVHSGKFEYDETYKFGKELEGGVYIVKITQNKTVESIRLVKY